MKHPPLVRKFARNGPFELHFEHNCSLAPVLFLQGRLSLADLQCAIAAAGWCWIPFLGTCAWMMNDASTANAWVALCTNVYSSNLEKSSINKFVTATNVEMWLCET